MIVEIRARDIILHKVAARYFVLLTHFVDWIVSKIVGAS